MNPTDRLSALDDYQSGAMSDDDADRFEHELFAGDAGEDDARFLDTMIRAARHLAERTTFHIGHTRREVEALLAKHDCVFIDCGRERVVHVTVKRHADLFITRFALDLGGVDRVEVENHVEGVGHVKTMRDIRFDPSDGALYGVCEAELWHMSVADGRRVTSKFFGFVGESRRLLGENEFQVSYLD